MVQVRLLHSLRNKARKEQTKMQWLFGRLALSLICMMQLIFLRNLGAVEIVRYCLFTRFRFVYYVSETALSCLFSRWKSRILYLFILFDGCHWIWNFLLWCGIHWIIHFFLIFSLQRHILLEETLLSGLISCNFFSFLFIIIFSILSVDLLMFECQNIWFIFHCCMIQASPTTSFWLFFYVYEVAAVL